VPRVINVICDRALLGAYSLDRHTVTAGLVRSAAAEVFGRRFSPHWLPWALTAAGAALLVLTTVTLWNLPPWSAHASTARAAAPPERAAPPAAPAPVSAIARPPPQAAALGELLAAHPAEADTDSAFGTLFRLWGAKYQPGSTDPCTQATQQGLECVNERGSFGQLRLYNRPAILLLNDSTGATHQVVLASLGDEQAGIELAGSHSVGIGELSRYWLGDFVMLWRPVSSPVKVLSVGMRGADVRWLRQSLQRLHGVSDDVQASDVFDAQLTDWVRDFQRQHQLAVDGIAGVRTQIALASTLGGPDGPLLSAADTHHGG
jgi:general secretion pathway protein A